MARKRKQEKLRKSKEEKMREASLRRLLLEEGIPWINPSRVIPNKKRQANKKACRQKITPSID